MVMAMNPHQNVSAQQVSQQGTQAANQAQKNAPKTERSSFDKTLDGAQKEERRGSGKRAVKSRVDRAVIYAAQKYKLPAGLIRAVIRQESGGNPKATSHCGAQGLMQLMPGTARDLGVKDAYNIEQNIDGGAKYIRQMMDRYNGNIDRSLAAYNAGPGAVDKYNGIPPYKETQNYVVAVKSHYRNDTGQAIEPNVQLDALSESLARTQAAFAETVVANAMLSDVNIETSDVDQDDDDRPLPPNAIPV